MEDTTPDKQKQHPTAPPQNVGYMDVMPTHSSAPDAIPADTVLPTPPPQADTSAPEGPGTPSENHPSLATPSTSTHAEHEAHQLLSAHAAARTNRPPLAAIIVAVVIALALIGVTVFAYMSTRNATRSEGDDHANTEQTTPQENQATTTDVDDASKEVDSALTSVDDVKDLPESDLTDQTLGL